MIKLEDYKQKMAGKPQVEAQISSDIQCPDCGEETFWAESSMFTRYPPMRRLICAKCDWSEVVPVAAS